MKLHIKAGLIQAVSGAVLLAILIQPAFAIGYGDHVWLLFMPLPLFFAMGANLRLLPSLVVCFVVGQLWAFVNGAAMGASTALLGQVAGGLVATIITIFAILLLHNTLLKRTVLGNVPALFTGMALTFFAFSSASAEGPAITPMHVTGFFLYGVVLAAATVLSGGYLCGLLLGKDWMTRLEEAGEESSETTTTAV